MGSRVILAVTADQADVLARIAGRRELPISRATRSTVRGLIRRGYVVGDAHHHLPGSHRLTGTGQAVASLLERLANPGGLF